MKVGTVVAWIVVFVVVRPTESGAETEVGELYMAVLVDQYVVWFDVTMDESQFMHTGNGTHEFRYVEPKSGDAIQLS